MIGRAKYAREILQEDAVFIVLPIDMISEKATALIVADARGDAAGSSNLLPSTVPATNNSTRGGIL